MLVFGSTLNRMIFWELVKVFLLSLGSLTGLFLIAGVVQQASQMGLSLKQVLSIIPLFVPSTLPYTIPATTLFASCCVYGRLSHDNEVVAIKGAGVHLFSILKPALLLGVIATTTTGALYYYTIPITQQMLQDEIFKDPEEVLYNALRRERCLRHPSFPYVMYVRDVQGKRLIDVVLKRRAQVTDQRTGLTAPMGYDMVARAREAQLRADPEQSKIFIDAKRLLIHDKNTRGATNNNGPFPIDLPDNITSAEGRMRPMALTWEQIGPRVASVSGEETRVKGEIAENRTMWEAAPDGTDRARFAIQDGHLKGQLAAYTRIRRNVESEYWMRPALAFGCFVFALIGCPVGIWANRADYLSTFVICFLPTIFVYYPLLLAGGNMGKDGKLPLGLGFWLANIVVGFAGVALTWRLLRR